VQRRHSRLSGVLAVVVGLVVAVAGTATSTAQGPVTRAGTTGTTGSSNVPAGVIAGRVTGPDGQALPNISVVAAPAGNDAMLTQTTTDAGGNYALVVAPGSYDVAFNSLDPTDSRYAPQVYGGPGPSATDTCLVCGGAPQVVVNGQITAGIDAMLEVPVQKGTIRPLSGNTIRVIDNRLSFRFGCHEDGIGCVGKGVLRIGTSTSAAVVSTVHFTVFSDHTATLHFVVPSAVRARLKKAKHNALPAIVQLTTTPSSTTTKFTLVLRP
jgi:carboxypeptidase family protein